MAEIEIHIDLKGHTRRVGTAHSNRARGKETDEYSIETWEEIALRLADQCGIPTPTHSLLRVASRPLLLSRRFDRVGALRIPFLSAMAMLGSRDGEHGSYPEIVDALAQHGARAKFDAQALRNSGRFTSSKPLLK